MLTESFLAPLSPGKVILLLNWNKSSKDFIATATQNLSVDPQKIVLIGYSRGAMEAINLIKNNDTTFSALIIMASNFKFKNKLFDSNTCYPGN
ncbi:hypothetical protein [Aquimarina hainanensis]|uniref:hypothetical protein n=1 Tax=Aquimarina hainanensis TaxID=1578017 RepID=UPI00360EC88D